LLYVSCFGFSVPKRLSVIVGQKIHHLCSKLGQGRVTYMMYTSVIPSVSTYSSMLSNYQIEDVFLKTPLAL